MLPPISASIGSIILFLLVVSSTTSAGTTVRSSKVLMVRVVPRFVVRNEERKDRGQEHKDQRLHKTDEQLQEIERNGNQPRQRGHHMDHRFEHGFARINIAEEPEAQRDRPKKNRDNLEPADDEKDEDHQDFQNPGRLAFRAKNMHDDPADAVGLDRPDDPADEKDRGHRESQIQVCVRAAQQGPIDMKTARSRIVMSPADGPDPGKKPKPIKKEDKNKDGQKKPEGLLDRGGTDHVLEEVVETSQEPL